MNSLVLFLTALLFIFKIEENEACLSGTTGDYRNLLLELSSTTPCGVSGEEPLGVCVPSRTCNLVGGVELGRHNCPLMQNTCCRPVASCNATSIAINMLWQSGSFMTTQRLQHSDCELRIIPSSDTCYIRVDFDSADIQSTEIDECQSSSLTIKGQAEGDGQPLCGTLNHKTTFVRVGHNLLGMPRSVTFELKLHHVPHNYSIRLNHVKCSDVRRFDTRKFRMGDMPLERTGKAVSRKNLLEPSYLGRMYAVAYTKDRPIIRPCPVTFISKDTVIGTASCALRLGGPGTSKGLMVVHGNPHAGPKSSYPRRVSELAKYVASNGIVVKKMVFHPMYNHQTHENDIAIMRLHHEYSGAVEPVTLPVRIDDFVDLNVFMTRYRTYKMAKDVEILANAEELPTRVVKNTVCKTNSLSSVASVTSNNTICIASTPRTESPCKGEPGSPIVHVGSSGTVTLIGLMMGNYHHCEDRSLEYAEPALKIINYLDFIDVATSPLYTVPAVDNSSSFTPVVNWFNSLWSTTSSEGAETTSSS